MCLTLCDPMGCSLQSSSVHGIFQARVLEWVAISFCRGSSQPRDRTRVSHIVGRRFTVCATREVLGWVISLMRAHLCIHRHEWGDDWERLVRGDLTLLPHMPSSSFCEAQLACSPSSVSREKEIHTCFFKVLRVLCFLWSCGWVGHTAKLRVSVGGRHSREWTLRGRCGARNAVTPPELGTDRGASWQLPVVGRTFLPHIPLCLLLLL